MIIILNRTTRQDDEYNTYVTKIEREFSTAIPLYPKLKL